MGWATSLVLCFKFVVTLLTDDRKPDQQLNQRTITKR
jgi:hypothetical protein